MLQRLMLLFALTPIAATSQQMAITFDDLPAAGQKPATISRLEIAQSILATLKQQNMPPIYGFINGIRTSEDPATFSVLEAWRAAGQPLGSHTWSHPNFEDISPAEFEADIEKNEPLLRKYMAGEDWHWLRYPYLHEGETTAKHREVRTWLKAHNYKVADVTMDFEDYLWNEPYTRCVAKGDTAAIVQLHDSFLATASSHIETYRTLAHNLYGHDIPYVLLLHAGAFEARILPELLDLYRTRGFTFISLPTAEADAAYSEDSDFGYPGGGALTEQLTAKRNLKFPPNSKPYKQLEATCR
jgi:peptidoglycan/xylan/chitin deacetylase (PgdA/CDA1 family)